MCCSYPKTKCLLLFLIHLHFQLNFLYFRSDSEPSATVTIISSDSNKYTNTAPISPQFDKNIDIFFLYIEIASFVAR